MRNRWIGLVLAGGVLLGCPTTDDDDSTGDDDVADDDAGDDDAGDDDTCEIALDEATFTEDCIGDLGPGNGTWHFELSLDCRATVAWVQTWDILEPCWGQQGPDEPCNPACPLAGKMTNIDFGWNETQGFWDVWELWVDFDTGADDPCLFPYACGESFELWACVCGGASEVCTCTDVSW